MPLCYECNEEYSRKEGKFDHGNIFICNSCSEDADDDICPECGLDSPEFIETGVCPSCGYDESLQDRKKTLAE